MLTEFACQQKKETHFASLQPITQSVYASGVVKGLNQYQVFAKNNGIIIEIYVSEGDTLEKGQKIMLIANQTAKLNKENSEANAQFNAVQNNRDRIEELLLNIEVLKEKKNNDSLLWVRQQNLWKQNVGTLLELEQKQLAFKNAKANYEASLLKYQQLKRQLNFSAKQAQLNSQVSNALFGDFIVRSEIEGRVYNLQKKVGEMVNASSPIAVIGHKSRFYLELQVDELDISLLKIGQKIFVSMDSHKGKVFEARLSKIHPMMNEHAKSFLVEAQFVNQPDQLYPNLTAEANIVISTKEKALLIPRSYLMNDSTVVLENGEKRKVTTGLMDYTKVEILTGLTEQDALVKP